jgi:hypothetical protein
MAKQKQWRMTKEDEIQKLFKEKRVVTNRLVEIERRLYELDANGRFFVICGCSQCADDEPDSDFHRNDCMCSHYVDESGKHL